MSTRKTQTHTELLLSAMTTVQIARLIDHIQLVLIPFGSTETHGESLAIGADSFIADAFCREVSRQLYPRVIVAPPIRWAPRGRDDSGPGTISLNETTLLHIFEDVADSLASHGMNRFLILTTHTASQDSAKRISNILNGRKGVAIADSVHLSDLIDTKIINKHTSDADTTNRLTLHDEIAVALNLDADIVRDETTNLDYMDNLDKDAPPSTTDMGSSTNHDLIESAIGNITGLIDSLTVMDT